MRALLLVMVVGMMGCATTTPREREAAAITQMAFGAPLVVGGALGALSAAGLGLGGAIATGTPATRGTGPAFLLGAAGAGVVSAVFLGAGVYLLSSGHANYGEAAEAATLSERRRVRDHLKGDYEAPPKRTSPREETADESDLSEGWGEGRRVLQPDDPIP